MDRCLSSLPPSVPRSVDTALLLRSPAMRVWTDGAVHVVVGEEGVEIHRPKQTPVLATRWKRPRGGFPARDVLAVVGKDPLRAWVSSDKDIRLLSLDGDAPRVDRRIEGHVLDAVGTGDGRVLACVGPLSGPRSTPEAAPPLNDQADAPPIPAAARRARLVVVDGDAPDLAAAKELALPAATRIVWPGGIWTKDAVPWPEDDDDDDDEPTLLDALAVASSPREGSLLFDEVVCSQNEHGFAVTSVYSGLIAALPPDASHVDFAVRIPTQLGETEILAARTDKGVVVVVCIEGRHASILHIARDGRVLAHRDKVGRDLAWGMGPPVVQGDRVMVFEGGVTSHDRVHDLSLSDLAITKSVEIGHRPSGRLSAHGAPGGEALILGLGGAACYVKRGGRGRVSCDVLERPPPPAPEPRASTSAPEIIKGPPSLILSKGEGLKPWSLSEGQALSIEIPFANQGGVGRGVSVEVAGPALAAGLVKPLCARIGDEEVPLVVKGAAARAELPRVPLPAAVMAVQEGKKGAAPAALAFLVASVELTGVKAGSSVLTVRITPLGAAGGRGSVMQGKSVTVGGASAS